MKTRILIFLIIVFVIGTGVFGVYKLCDTTRLLIGDDINRIGQNINIDMPKGEVKKVVDSVGWRGEGILLYTVSFSDDSFLKDIKVNSDWVSKLTKYMEVLMNGNETMEPILVYEDGSSIFEKRFKNAYYFVKDKNNNKKEIGELEKAYSYDIIMAVYDVDNRKLYYCEYDT